MAHYEQIRRLGQGAFGEVWLVFDRALGVQRALKLVPPGRVKDPTNFYAEPRTLKALAHPNVVAVEDAGRDVNGHLYIAMEYLPRGSIEDEARGAIVPIRKAVRLVCDVCRALEYAHTQGYVHRDIKPANVLIAADGSGKLSDFGLAARASKDGTASPYGYLAHLAPEVIGDDRTSAASDIYAVGVTLYRLVNGDSYLPQLNSPDDMSDEILAGRFPDRHRYRPFVPRRVRAIANRAMHVEPGRRYGTAADLRHDLEQVHLACDWAFTATPDGTSWSCAVGDLEYEAAAATDATGSWEFVLSKGRRGSRKRRVVADCAASLCKTEMEKHVHRVLARITQSGS